MRRAADFPSLSLPPLPADVGASASKNMELMEKIVAGLCWHRARLMVDRSQVYRRYVRQEIQSAIEKPFGVRFERMWDKM